MSLKTSYNNWTGTDIGNAYVEAGGLQWWLSDPEEFPPPFRYSMGSPRLHDRPMLTSTTIKNFYLRFGAALIQIGESGNIVGQWMYNEKSGWTCENGNDAVIFRMLLSEFLG